jgi:methionyl-tRNA formyltransferase
VWPVGGPSADPSPPQPDMLERPIRVVLFGGPYLHPAAVEFLARLEQHPDIELKLVLCEGPGPGMRHRLANLWRRRGAMALVVLVMERLAGARRWLRDPRTARLLSVHARRGLAKLVVVPDVHAGEVLSRLRSLAPDLGLVYGAPILRPELFQLPTFGTLGIHHGRVPDYRGKKTTFWEMYNDEDVAGVTIQRINPGIDTGDVARAGVVAIGRKSYARVEHETEALGYDLFIEAILDVKRGTARYEPQNPATLPARKYRQPTAADVLRLTVRRIARAVGLASTAARGRADTSRARR